MLASLEALAMAGEDYGSSGVGLEEWERADLEETPAYLLAYDDEEGPWYFQGVGDSEESINSDHHGEDLLGKSGGCKKLTGRLRLRGLVIKIMAMCRLMLLLRVEHHCKPR